MASVNTADAQQVGILAGASTAVIHRDGIFASGAQSVQELLRQVPMVTGFGNAAQGASALFGPDAAAGAINIVTRRDFQGVEATARAGIANNYHNYDAGFLWGKRTDTSGLLLHYNFEFRDDLSANHRSFSRANHSLFDPEAGVEGGVAEDFSNWVQGHRNLDDWRVSVAGTLG